MPFQRDSRHSLTSEAVAAGHPDKVADQISDAVVDALLAQDPGARAAVETLVTRDLVVIAGEVRGPRVDCEAIARAVIRDLDHEQPGFDSRTVEILVRVAEQSPEIAAAVDADGVEEGASDQGIMYGYATAETPTLMPAPLVFAQGIISAVADLRAQHPYDLGPDGKAQVTVAYHGDGLRRVSAVVLSVQHRPGLSRDDVQALCGPAILAAVPTALIDEDTRLLINPSGSFTVGGPAADTGLTGRKLAVDTYGGAVPHGGGAFSGKDPSKVDRSAAYAARYVAKNIVHAGLARRCLVQIAYAIGESEPVAVDVNSFGTGVVSDFDLGLAVRAALALTPRGIRRDLGLDRPIYRVTATGGHFGRAPTTAGEFSWELTDLGPALLKALGFVEQ
jgi:S-adenosylmethionine synthetase